MSDSLAPSEIVEKLIDISAAKAPHTIRDLLIRGSLSGALLGFGASLALLVTAQTRVPFVGALVFPVGFAMIIALGLEVLTSNFGITPLAVLSHRATARKMVSNWTCGSSIDSSPRRRGLPKDMPPTLSVIAAVLPLLAAWCLLCASPAFAQVEDPLEPLTAMPSLGTTSPLGISPGGSVGAVGVPLDATEITSFGVSPAPTGSVTGTVAMPTSGAITSSGTTCSTGGMSPSGTYGSTASYDGGGTAPGTAAPATAATTGSMATGTTGTLPTAATTDPTSTPGTSTSSEMSVASGTSTSLGMLSTSGMSGMCGSGSSSIASSSTPTSTLPTTPGGFARTGIPLDSTEISNLGISSAPAVPTVGVLPIVGTVGPSPLLPTMPTVSPTTASTTTCATTGGVGGAGIGSAGTIGAGNAGVAGTSISARMLRQFILCQRQ
jgi:hypothetical protein